MTVAAIKVTSGELIRGKGVVRWASMARTVFIMQQGDCASGPCSGEICGLAPGTPCIGPSCSGGPRGGNCGWDRAYADRELELPCDKFPYIRYVLGVPYVEPAPTDPTENY